MDLIFKRYADPYTLLDTMIDNQSFDEFVCTFVRLDDDDKLWDMYIHKCWENISFNDFKARLYGTSMIVIGSVLRIFKRKLQKRHFRSLYAVQLQEYAEM